MKKKMSPGLFFIAFAISLFMSMSLKNIKAQVLDKPLQEELMPPAAPIGVIGGGRLMPDNVVPVRESDIGTTATGGTIGVTPTTATGVQMGATTGTTELEPPMYGVPPKPGATVNPTATGGTIGVTPMTGGGVSIGTSNTTATGATIGSTPTTGTGVGIGATSTTGTGGSIGTTTVTVPTNEQLMREQGYKPGLEVPISNTKDARDLGIATNECISIEARGQVCGVEALNWCKQFPQAPNCQNILNNAKLNRQ